MSNLSSYNFNASEVEPSKGFELIPRGDYCAAIIASQMRTTNDGNGEQLVLRFQILDGHYKNRLVFANLNMKNLSEKATEISRRDLSAICHAVGVLSPSDSSELHGKPLTLSIAIKKNKNSGADENSIMSYKSRGGMPASSVVAGETVKTPW